MKKIKYYFSQIIAEISYLPKNLGYLWSKKRKAMYVGCTGHGNLGDEAILSAISQMLAKYFFLYEVSYTNPTAGKFLRRLFIKNPDLIILGGGTIIRKGVNESYLKVLNKQLSFYPKAKTATLGPGVAEPAFADYIGFPIDVSAWKSFLNRSSFISVRGKRSKDLLDSWELNKEVVIFHDPAIWFTKKTFIKKEKKKKIGINFADIGNRIHGKNQNSIKIFAQEFIKYLQQNDWSIYLFPTTKTDLDFMLGPVGLDKNKDLHIYENYTNIDDSLNFLETLDIFVGQRLHSVIFAATVATPFFALEYEPKTLDFLETINMQNSSARVDNLDLALICGKIESIYHNLDIEQSQLHEKMMKAKNEQIESLNLFLKNI